MNSNGFNLEFDVSNKDFYNNIFYMFVLKKKTKNYFGGFHGPFILYKRQFFYFHCGVEISHNFSAAATRCTNI